MNKARVNTPALKLAKNFTDEAYPYRITIDIEFNPDISKTDFMFRNNPDYVERKLTITPEHKEKDLHRLFKIGEVHDYCIFRKGTHISIHLKNEDDYMIATAAVVPENVFKIDFTEHPNLATKRKLKKKAKSFQNAFNKAGMGGAVTFLCDVERRMVRAETKNGYDFVRLFGIARRLSMMPTPT